jgi:hypothetical protein
VNRPPVAGRSETSPRVVPNVERSSWANWIYLAIVYIFRRREGRYICGAKHPFALSAVCDCDSREVCVACLCGWLCGLLDGGYWFCHFDSV